MKSTPEERKAVQATVEKAWLFVEPRLRAKLSGSSFADLCEAWVREKENISINRASGADVSYFLGHKRADLIEQLIVSSKENAELTEELYCRMVWQLGVSEQLDQRLWAAAPAARKAEEAAREAAKKAAAEEAAKHPHPGMSWDEHWAEAKERAWDRRHDAYD